MDEDAVDAIGELPGIEYALSSCDLANCTVTVRASPDVTAAQLLAALGDARDTGADQMTLRSEGTGSVEVQADSDPADDATAAALATEAVAAPGVESLTVALDADGATVSVAADDEVPVWDVAEALWPDVEELDTPALTVTGAASPGRPSRVTAEGAFPEDALALVRRLEDGATPRLTGVVVDGDDLVLGVQDVGSAETLETALAGAPDAEGLSIQVAVTTDVLTYRPDDEEPSGAGGGSPADATEEDRRALVAALNDALDAAPGTPPGVTARVESGTVAHDTDDLAGAATAVDAARAAQPDAATRVPITVTSERTAARGTVTVELGARGDTDLLLLAVALRSGTDPRSVSVDADLREDDDVEVFVGVTIDAPDLATGVRAVAGVFSGWAGTATPLHVSIGTVDPEGRTPRVSLRVDRQDGTWVPSGRDHQTEERVAYGIAAWEDGAGLRP